MKKIFTILGTLLLLTILSSTVMAEKNESAENNLSDIINIEMKDVVDNKSADLSAKEKAIAFLLASGWTIDDIYDSMNENEILEYAEALSIEGKRTYIASYEADEENCITIELNRQEFDYYSNLSDNPKCNLSEMSSSGIIGIQEMASNETDVGGMSAHQILMNTNTCYLRQDLYATWMGNKRYLTSFRCEWMKMPVNQYRDVFGITFEDDLMFLEEKLTSYVFKCSSPYVSGDDDVYFSKKSPAEIPTFMKQGVYCQENIYPYEIVQYPSGASGGPIYPLIDHSRAYMKVNVYIRDDNPTSEYFRFWSYYYHAKRSINMNLNISLLPDFSTGISISPSGYHVKEDQHCYIYVKNPFYG